MKKKVKGAWIIHHAKKVQTTTSQDFDSISFAGKCGSLLSAISADTQEQLKTKRLEALAKANYISPKTELPAILDELERQRLILKGAGGIEVLGITGQGVLEHTSTIFNESNHEVYEDAVIGISEIASEMPITDIKAIEYISDTYKLPTTEVKNTLLMGSGLHFFDSEPISKDEKLLFNGNLFRKNDAKKINAVLSSLSSEESRLLIELNEKLESSGCIPLSTAKKILTENLFSRLHSIGMFDVSVVGNLSGKNYFVTRPAAFSKFTDTIADDALDLAKALVASLTYGMTISSYYRGRIQMISLLMGKLINGGEVGPATAIGNDYQALEFKGVVRITPAKGGMFTMRLLKPEVGKLALSVIQNGDITAETIVNLPGAKVTEFINPETTREYTRKNCTEAVRIQAKNLLEDIRLGELGK
ncbi:hypothetical protein WFO77_17270 [Yersinia enterocolitica]|uniref:hypothetical protein n=1 Tax=Yersinia mollaretii TaxID=33060 RepID=UPI001427BB89|nr:hypothetical protein [Yersinia mollaretii]MDA5534612.1 hypothetical protein [Yersinia mollaretii]NIL02533.1 hypothetical protein [Yersinia mollaretii]HDL7963635.1 hypothetical protein [Yersinia enterocolitica]